MNNRKNKQPLGRGGMAIMWIIIAFIMAMAGGADSEALIPAIATVALVSVIMIAATAANRKKNGTQGAAKERASVRPERPERPVRARREDGQTEARKLNARRTVWYALLGVSLALLLVLPKELLSESLRLIERFGLSRAVRIMQNKGVGSLPGLVIFAGLALLAVVSLLRILSLKRRIDREPENIPAARTRIRPEDDREVAVGCHHASGKEKYIEQLDSYLKAGLIDRAEYKVLKERYSKLEIPEDYH